MAQYGIDWAQSNQALNQLGSDYQVPQQMPAQQQYAVPAQGAQPLTNVGATNQALAATGSQYQVPQQPPAERVSAAPAPAPTPVDNSGISAPESQAKDTQKGKWGQAAMSVGQASAQNQQIDAAKIVGGLLGAYFGGPQGAKVGSESMGGGPTGV